MYDYQIDVPVLLIFFNRPGCFAKVFEQVKKARPSKLFLYQDGAREGNEKDAAGVARCREIALDIDWNCEIHTLFQEKNYGCDPSGYIARKWAFESVDRCIILEDDCVPSQSFFFFCQELLEKYKDDQRINMICGMNNLETWNTPYSYLFTETGSICGVATWKRIMDEWVEKSPFFDHDYDVGLMRHYFQSGKTDLTGRIQHWKECNNSGVAYHETVGGIVQCTQSRLNIVPAKNMIVNNGNSIEGGTHSTNSNAIIPRGLRRIFTMPSYEIEFPLKHPRYVINDVEFQKRLFRVMGTGHPAVQFYRKIEKSFLILKHEGMGALIRKIKKSL